MAKRSKSTNKMASIALMVVGAGLSFWGYQKSGGLESKLTSAITGSNTDNVMILYISGAVCLAVGVYLFLKNK